MAKPSWTQTHTERKRYRIFVCIIFIINIVIIISTDGFLKQTPINRNKLS